LNSPPIIISFLNLESESERSIPPILLIANLTSSGDGLSAVAYLCCRRLSYQDLSQNSGSSQAHFPSLAIFPASQSYFFQI